MKKYWKLIIIIYSLLLTFAAISSITLTWVSSSTGIFVGELLVSLSATIGCWLALQSKVRKWWLLILVTWLIGEALLMYDDTRIALGEATQWIVILAPAVILNLKVTGILKFENTSKRA